MSIFKTDSTFNNLKKETMRTFIFYTLIMVWFTNLTSCTPEMLEFEISADDDTTELHVDPQTEEEDDELEPSS